MNFSFETKVLKPKLTSYLFKMTKFKIIQSKKSLKNVEIITVELRMEYLLCNLQLVLEFNIAQIVTPPRGKI